MMQPERWRVAVLCLLLLWEALVDIQKKEISVPATSLLAVGGMVYLWTARGGICWDVWLSLCPGLLLLGLSLGSGGKLGMGDAIVATLLGLWLPLFSLAVLLLAACTLSALFGVVLLLRGRRARTAFPFLPFLFLAYVPLAAVSL